MTAGSVLTPRPDLPADVRAEWDRQVPRWAALRHFLPCDQSLLEVYVTQLVLRGQLLEQNRAEGCEAEPVALEMLREMTQSVAAWRELLIPTDG